MRELLSQHRLIAKGNKDDLIRHLMERLSADELQVLVAGVVLYSTTAAGNEAIKTIDYLCAGMLGMFTRGAARPPSIL